MSRSTRRRAGALAVVAMACALLPVTAAAAQTEDEGPTDGVIAVGYGEPTDLRPGEGWTLECDRVGALDGVEVLCEPEGITLISEGYDPEWGTHALRTVQRAGSLTLPVTYRVRLAPPPAPEFATTRIDLPIAVGAQQLIPLIALGVSCGLCTVDGGSVFEIGEIEVEGVHAGVSATHLSLRSSVAGDVAVPVRITDDSGQEVEAELEVTFVPAGEPALGALHVLSGAASWAPDELVWGDGVAGVCDPTRSVGLLCGDDGAVTIDPGREGPAQVLFRAADAAGHVAWGSITASDEAEGPAAADWSDEAPFGLALANDDEEAEESPEPPLTALARLLEGVPAP